MKYLIAIKDILALVAIFLAFKMNNLVLTIVIYNHYRLTDWSKHYMEKEK